jgi:predicted nuclease of restriction endonuclease-like (RecB) superfamily
LKATKAANLKELGSGMAGRKKAASAPAQAAATVISSRGTRGRASFPTSPPLAELPSGYAETLSEIKQRIQQERLRVVMAANSAMVLLYWDIGRMILARQEREGWGARVIDRLSADLREEYPDMQGFSRRNLLFMRSFAEAYPHAEKVKQLVSQLPWGHIIRLLQRVKEPAIREWYIRESIEHGWSRSILELQIDGHAHERKGKALTNFKATLPPADSDMAGQIFKDPYLFDFLGTADPRREREVEQALVDHIQRFLLELGSGFAFVGRQVQLAFESRDYYLDLLFYHLKLRCYVVIELKAVPFEPGFAGQMNMYLSAVDDLLRHPDDKPTIGLLLCRAKDRLIVEYALRDVRKPIGVAGWETTLVEKLPENLKGSLPTVEEIEAELAPKQGRLSAPGDGDSV